MYRELLELVDAPPSDAASELAWDINITVHGALLSNIHKVIKAYRLQRSCAVMCYSFHSGLFFQV